MKTCMTHQRQLYVNPYHFFMGSQFGDPPAYKLASASTQALVILLQCQIVLQLIVK